MNEPFIDIFYTRSHRVNYRAKWVFLCSPGWWTMHQATVAQNCTDTSERVMNSWEWGDISEGLERRNIRLIESNAKYCHLKRFTCKGTLLQVFICLRPPPLLGFCLGWSSDFEGSESVGYKVCIIWSPTGLSTPQPPPPPTPPSHTERVGGGEPERRLEQSTHADSLTDKQRGN